MAENSGNGVSGQVIRYATSNVARHFLSLLTSFVRAKILSPELYGLWVLIKTFPTYGEQLHLGSQQAMYYRLPKHLANGEHDHISATEATAFWGMLVMNLLFCAGIIAAVLWYEFEPALETGLLLACPVILLTGYYEFIIDRLSGMREFDRIGVSHYLFAVTGLVLTALLAWLYGLAGVMIAVSTTLVVTTSYLVRGHRKWWPMVGFRLPLFSELVRMGLPIVALNIMLVLMVTLDRFLIVYFLDAAQLGLYGLAVIVMITVLKVPSVSRQVIEPETMAQSDAHNELAYFEQFYGLPLLYIAFLLPFLIGGAAFLLEPVLALALPEYLDVVPAAQVLLWGAFFLGLTYPVRGVAVAAGLQFRLAMYMILPLLVGLGLSIFGLSLGYGIEWVAVVKGVSFAMMYLIMNYALYRRYPHFGTTILRYLAVTFVLFIYLLLVGNLCVALSVGGGPLLEGLARTLAFTLAMLLPLAIGVWRGLIKLPRFQSCSA